MINIRQFFVVTILVTYQICLVAQNSKTTVVVFGQESKEELISDSPKSNAIKTSILAPLLGNVTFEYEREISNAFSVIVSGGPRFKPLSLRYYDLVKDGPTFKEPIITLIKKPEWRTDLNDNIGNPEHIRKWSYNAAFGFKYYFKHDGFEGIYLSPLFSVERDRFAISKIAIIDGKLARTPADVDIESFTSQTAILRVGHQHRIINLIGDVFLEAGYRWSTYKYQDIGINFQNEPDSDFYIIKKQQYYIGFGYYVGLMF